MSSKLKLFCQSLYVLFVTMFLKTQSSVKIARSPCAVTASFHGSNKTRIRAPFAGRKVSLIESIG